jgi:hypothetical protein
MSHRLTAVILLLLTTVVARADEWKSPDGAIAVAVPNPARFPQTDPPPPTLVYWQSPDGRMRMFVGEKPVTPGADLDQSVLEQDAMRVTNEWLKKGKLLSSSVEVRNGHRVVTITTQGESEATTVYFTQVITLVDAKVYAVGASCFGKDTRSDPDTQAFLASFRILAPPSPAPPQPAPRRTAPPVEQKTPVEQVSYTAGMIAGACLFVAGIAWVVNRLTRSTAKKPRRRGRPERHDDDDDEDS